MNRQQTPGFSLANTVVLVTRPMHQAQHLCSLIEAEGARTILFPVLEIQDPQDNSAVLNLVNRLDEFDIAIFISANAVTKAMDLVLPRRDWPCHLKIAVVGTRTAAALQEYGLTVDICPEEKFNSESLLALAEMRNVAGKKIVIFRGEGGRELLADTLRQRGADIEYAEVYRRSKPVDTPEHCAPKLEQILAIHRVDVIVVTSNESLRNLWEIAGPSGQQQLLQMPLAVISPRTAALAQELGFKHPAVIAPEANDEGLVTAIKVWSNMRDDS